jgi:hypothetical protein
MLPGINPYKSIGSNTMQVKSNIIIKHNIIMVKIRMHQPLLTSNDTGSEGMLR